MIFATSKFSLPIFVIFIGTLLIFPHYSFSGPTSTRSAKELNTLGFRLYKLGNYGEALDYFKNAIEVNPDYALAHYNLACTLGVLRKQNKECYYEAYRERIVHHLSRAVELDPNRRERMKSDPDLEPIHDTVGYQIMLGKNPNKTKDAISILINVTWYSPGLGMYGPLSGLNFKTGGVVEKWTFDIDSQTQGMLKGIYKVDGNKVTITMTNGTEGPSTYNGQLEKDGTLQFEEMFGPFMDMPEECSA